MKPLPYRPQIDMPQLYAFDERLRNVPGSWNTIGRSFVHAGAPGVIRLRWLIAGERWCDEAGFLDFLDVRQNRLLVRCFLKNKPVDEEIPQAIEEPEDADADVPEHVWQRTWTMEALLKEMGPEVKPRRLVQGLHFLEKQEYIVAHGPDEWVSGSFLEHVEQFGPTFAWSVQAHLQERHHALTRRCVSFKEWQVPQLNELDVLAFAADGLIMTVECKSNEDIPFEELVQFVQRARAFPADVALLFIDTESEERLTEYLQQLNTILNREHMDLGDRHLHEGTVIYHLTDNLYVANTAGGIDPALEATLRLGSALKQPSYVESK